MDTILYLITSLSDRQQRGILLGLLIDSVGIDKPETTTSHLTTTFAKTLAFHISQSSPPRYSFTVVLQFYSI